MLKNIHRYSTHAVPFYKKGNVPNFGPNYDPSRLRTAVILNCGTLSQIKNKLSKVDDRPITIPKHGIVRSPQLREPLAQCVPKRVKVEKILYILHSSGPRRVQLHQCYTTCWGVADVKSLPCHISQHFTGTKISSHTRVNLEPRHISETFTDRKLKFYAHLHRVLEYENLSARGRAGGATHLSVNLGHPSYLGNY